MRGSIIALLALAAGCAQETCPDVLPTCPEGTILAVHTTSNSVKGTAELYTEDCFTCAELDEEGLFVEPTDCSEPTTEF